MNQNESPAGEGGAEAKGERMPMFCPDSITDSPRRSKVRGRVVDGVYSVHKRPIAGGFAFSPEEIDAVRDQGATAFEVRNPSGGRYCVSAQRFLEASRPLDRRTGCRRMLSLGQWSEVACG